MSTASKTNPVPHDWTADTKVTRYDTVAGWLVALVVMVGFMSLVLFLLWLTTVWSYRPPAPPIKAIEINLPGPAAAAEGYARDIEEPGVEELAEVLEPNLAETLEAMTDAVSSVAGAMNAMEGAEGPMGTGSGQGDSRKSGPGGEGEGAGFWERWDIRYSVDDIEKYAEQLDHFNIELGVLGGGVNGIEYVSDMSSQKPKTRSIQDASTEKRFYFNFARPDMQRLDASLLGRAGISTAKRFPVQFYPDNIIKQLLTLEAQKLNGRNVKEVSKTIFGVRGGSGAYEYYVIDQEFFFGN